MDDATKQAKADAEVGIEELAGDIYYNNFEPQIRGVSPIAGLQHLEVMPRKRN